MSKTSYGSEQKEDNNKKLPDNISEEDVLYWATEIVAQRFTRSNYLSSPDATREFLKIILAQEHREQFIIIFVDNQNGVIGSSILFQGTIDCAAVYPREIVKAVLENNAAAVILAHNHPSGCAEPSRADIQITEKIVTALNTIDVKVLDHLIVGGTLTISLAERGMI